MLTRAQRIALREIQCRFPRGELVLDVGFGAGEFLEALATAGYRLAGTEITESFWKSAQERLAQYQPWLMCTDRPNMCGGPLVAMTCFEVLEHVPDPAAFLATMPRFVPTWFSVPNERRWGVAMTGKYEPWDYPPNHLRRFTRDALARALTEAGYRNVVVREMRVAGREVLQPFLTAAAYRLGFQRNVGEYDQAVGNHSALGALVRVGKTATLPATALVAAGLNAWGYVGGNLLATGVKG